MPTTDANNNDAQTSGLENNLVGYIVRTCRQNYWHMQIIVKLANFCGVFIVFPILILISFLKTLLKYLVTSFEIKDQKNRHVVITGCGSGIGRETAILLAKKGVQVYAGVRRASSIDQLYSDYNGPNLHIDLCDVGSDESVQEYGQILRQRLGKHSLWALINNAGLQTGSIDHDFVQMDACKTAMNVNFYGSVRMVKLCKALMDEEEIGGRLIFVMSVSSYYPVPYAVPYVASKSALLGYVNVLRLEHAQSKITIHTCVSGFVPTKMVQKDHQASFLAQLDTLSPQDRELFTRDIVEKRHASSRLQIDVLTMDNSVAMVAESLANAVICKWPLSDFWISWDWPLSKALSLMPIDSVVWYLSQWLIHSGDVTMTQILRHRDRLRLDHGKYE